MKAIILEDEAIAARRLQRLLDSIFPEEIEIIAIYDSVIQLVEHLSRKTAPDLLFLDIMVADGNSFALFDLVKVQSKVIFITAYNEFAVQAFRKNAVDYILKPIKKELLEEAVNKVKKLNTHSLGQVQKELYPYKERFLIRFGNKLNSVRTEDIAYIYSQDKLSFFKLKNGKRISSDLRLQSIYDSLDHSLFFKANRQIIVHIDALNKIIRHSRSRLNLKLNPPFDEDIIVSTENTPVFKEWMER